MGPMFSFVAMVVFPCSLSEVVASDFYVNNSSVVVFCLVVCRFDLFVPVFFLCGFDDLLEFPWHAWFHRFMS